MADELASKRNSNDLIIFLAAPAHRRLRPISVSGISADGWLSGPIREGDFFLFLFLDIPSGRGGVYGTGEEEMRCSPRPARAAAVSTRRAVTRP